MGMGKLHKDFRSTVSVEKEHVDAQAGAPEDPITRVYGAENLRPRPSDITSCCWFFTKWNHH